MDKVTKYLSNIGKRGGKKSKRVLTSEQAREMVRIRELKKKSNGELLHVENNTIDGMDEDIYGTDIALRMAKGK